MVPSIFLFLDELPLSPSGKVDRKALPIPEGVRPELEREYVAPRTPLEEQLAQMCSELLGIERVGIHDNFFDLGGHSLLATQLISRIREETGVELPLRTFFEHPTIAETAEKLSEAEAKGWKTQGPAMTPLSREAHRMKRSAIH
jgi:acyl carrier protein